MQTDHDEHPSKNEFTLGVLHDQHSPEKVSTQETGQTIPGRHGGIMHCWPGLQSLHVVVGGCSSGNGYTLQSSVRLPPTHLQSLFEPSKVCARQPSQWPAHDVGSSFSTLLQSTGGHSASPSSVHSQVRQPSLNYINV